jgi:hypothetical protein
VHALLQKGAQENDNLRRQLSEHTGYAKEYELDMARKMEGLQR